MNGCQFQLKSRLFASHGAAGVVRDADSVRRAEGAARTRAPASAASAVATCAAAVCTRIALPDGHCARGPANIGETAPTVGAFWSDVFWTPDGFYCKAKGYVSTWAFEGRTLTELEAAQVLVDAAREHIQKQLGPLGVLRIILYTVHVYIY